MVSFFIWIGVMVLGVLGIIFGSVTIWKWMELRQTSPDARLNSRVAALEAEVARLRDEVAEVIIAEDDRSRLDLPQERPLDAGR